MKPGTQLSPRPKVRVLLVDDSAVMRSLLRMVLEPQPTIEIAATAARPEDEDAGDEPPPRPEHTQNRYGLHRAINAS